MTDNGRKLAVLWRMGAYEEFVKMLHEETGLRPPDLEGCGPAIRQAARRFSPVGTPISNIPMEVSFDLTVEPGVYSMLWGAEQKILGYS